MSFPIPHNEIQRIEALRRYGLLEAPGEKRFDDFAMLASYICQTPMASVTIVDEGDIGIKELLVCRGAGLRATCPFTPMPSLGNPR